MSHGDSVRRQQTEDGQKGNKANLSGGSLGKGLFKGGVLDRAAEAVDRGWRAAITLGHHGTRSGQFSGGERAEAWEADIQGLISVSFLLAL